PRAARQDAVRAAAAGVVGAIDAKAVGLASHALGAGRATMEDAIDASAGLLCLKKVGDAVAEGEPLVECRFADPARFEAVAEPLRRAFTIADRPATPAPPAVPPPIVLDRVARP